VNSRVVGLACLALALVACAPRVAPSIEWPLSAREVRDALAAPLQNVRTLSGSGTVRQENGDNVLVADALLSLDVGRGVRLDVLSPVLSPLLTLVVTKNEITLLDFRRRRAVIGPATAQTTETLLRLRVDPRLLTEILTGGASLPDAAWRPVAPRGEAEEGLWTYAADSWRVGLDPHTRRPVLLAVDGDDPLVITWSHRQTVDQVEIARQVAIRRPRPRQGLRLSLAEVKANQPVDAALFQPKIPDGFNVQRLVDESGR
jgi:outer membrane lipoprotein-sorting protein